MILNYITDRWQLAREHPGISLLEQIEKNAKLHGLDLWIQIREKDLTSFELLSLVEDARRITSRYGAKLLVNTRVDVAIAAGADGVHLPDGSPEPRRWNSSVPEAFLFGVSCHNLTDVVAAQANGADYVLFGPVFTPLSKSSDLAPQGLEVLREAARSVQIPVLALGGITDRNAASCFEAGTAGIAGISLFQNRNPS